MPVRASGEQTTSRRNLELQRLPGAGTRDLEAEGDLGAGENRLGRVPRNLEAARCDSFARALQIRARRGSGAERTSIVRRVSPEPTEYADRPRHTRDVFLRPAPNPALPRKIVSTGCHSPWGVGKGLQGDGGIRGQKSCRPRWVSGGGASKCIFFNSLQPLSTAVYGSPCA